MPLYEEQRSLCVSDSECYPDYWCIGFKTLDGQRVKTFELHDDCELDKRSIASIFRKWRVVGFNYLNYDVPMILYAMSGASNSDLKRLNDDLIVHQVPPWVAMDRLDLRRPDFMDVIDLINVSPGAAAKPSLKLYAGRLHSKRMQELPYDPDEPLGPLKRQRVLDYMVNDLDDTIDLYNDLVPQIELRVEMSKQYGVDLRSKSDAQIAEAVIKAEAEKLLRRPVFKPEIKAHFFNYQVPTYMCFETPAMQEVLEFIRNVRFKVNAAGVVECPDRMQGMDVTIGATVYRMGIGGLHSKEKKASHYSDDTYVLKDRDVTSYYPSSILNQGMYPPSIGPKFLDVYRSIFERRLAAKKDAKRYGSELASVNARIAEIESRIKELSDGE